MNYTTSNNEVNVSKEDIYSRAFFVVIATLLYFPSVNFGLYSAEVFPYAFIFSILMLRRLYTVEIIFILLFSIISIFSIYSNFDKPGFAFEFFRSVGAYLNVILVFFVLLHISQDKIKTLLNLSKVIFIGLTILGLLQSSGLIESIGPILQFFVPRSSGEDLGGYRGVTLLSTEPARAGVEYLFLYLVYRFVFLKRKYFFLADMLIGIAVLFMFKSAVVLLVYLLMLTLLYKSKIIFIVILTLMISPLILSYDGRSVILINQLLSADSDNFFHLFMNASGNRVFSIWAVTLFSFQYPFGLGIGNWMESSMIAAGLTNYDLSTLNYFSRYGGGGEFPFRATGFLMNAAMDFGIVGFIGFLGTILYRLISFWKYGYESRCVILLFLIKISFVGSVGTPVEWVAIVVLLRYFEFSRTTKTTILLKQ
jgi:hypothetical protein